MKAWGPWGRRWAIRGGATRDPEESRRAEESRRSRRIAVEAGQVVLERVLDLLPMIAWLADPAGTIRYYNPRWYEFTGFPPGTHSPEAWWRVIHPDDVVATRAAWESSLANARPFDAIHRFRDVRDRPGLHYRWFHSRAETLCDHQGRLLHRVGTSVDIDAAHREYEQLRRLIGDDPPGDGLIRGARPGGVFPTLAISPVSHRNPAGFASAAVVDETPGTARKLQP
jgi:PAS domain-containing protein